MAFARIMFGIPKSKLADLKGRGNIFFASLCQYSLFKADFPL